MDLEVSKYSFLIIFISLYHSAFAEMKGTAYLDLEDGDTVTVYNKPGNNFKNCKPPNCEGVAWPDNSATVEITGKPTKVWMQDPYSKKWQNVEYYPVQVNYPRLFQCPTSAYKDKSGNPNLGLCQRVFGNSENNYMDVVNKEGWIDGDTLAEKRHTPLFKETKKPDCEPTSPMPKNKELTHTAQVIQKAQTANWEVAAQKLSKIAGKCEWTDSQKSPPQPPNPFDQLVLKDLQKQSVPQGIVDENNRPLTKAQMIEITALARTLYGEMANCFKSGLHHAIAVAKIAINRKNTPQRNEEWIRGDHVESKTDFSKLLTSPSQFNCWKPTLSSEVNGGFQLAMCPPSDPQQKFWNGARPPESEIGHWDSAMKIAAMAVLNPSGFSQSTSNLNELFYTSGDETIPGLTKETHPTIAGRKLKYNCVRTWK